MGDPVHVARAKIARAVRAGDREAEALARTELTEAHLERVIEVILARPDKPRVEAVERVCERLRAEALA